MNSNAKRQLNSPDSKSSAYRLLNSAEELYGRHGLYGVSLRNILAHADCGNKYAIQYHFGGQNGLVEAVLRSRLQAIEDWQERVLIRDGDPKDLRSVLNICFRPVLQQVNNNGERSFARFLVAVLNSTEGVQRFIDLYSADSTIGRLIQMLADRAPHLARDLLLERFRLTSIMVFSCVFNRLPAFSDESYAEAVIEDAIDMAAAGIAAPPRQAILRLDSASQAPEAPPRDPVE